MKTIYSEPYKYLMGVLRETRIKQNLTQAQLSETLGKPQSYVSKYERGDRRLDVIEFLEVCRQIQLDPHKLINEVNKPGKR